MGWKTRWMLGEHFFPLYTEFVMRNSDEFVRKVMNAFFSTEKGWAETADEVYTIFAYKRKEEKQKLREEKLEEQRAAASNLFVLNKATSDAKNFGKAEIDKMDVDVSSPGNNIAKYINLGKDYDE